MDNIRCGVLGLGRLGYWHAENLATRVKGAQVTCVADSLPDRAEKTAQDLDVKRWTTLPDEMFSDPDIDAVIIATPTSTHKELIQQAAKHGKHIFVEKPLTATIEEANEVIETIEQNQVSCQVGFMRRFDPAYSEAHRRIAAGDIGKPLYFKGISRDPGSPPKEFVKNSGGIFLDLLIHDFDIARFLIGSEVQTVNSQGCILLHEFMAEFNDVDQALTYLSFDSGAAGDIEGSRNAGYGYDIRGEVMGTEGTLMIGSLKHHDVQILNNKGCTYDIVPAFPERFKEAYVIEMIHFIDCLRKDIKPAVTEWDGIKALEIAAAATKSFEIGRNVSIASIGSI